MPAPTTNRTHCIVWSDYDTQPQVALAHGIRLDTNYYYWPGAWVQNRPGFMTGSGMPMRFAKVGRHDDRRLPGRHADDRRIRTRPTRSPIDTLLDRALGPEGYYGFFIANMHTDIGGACRLRGHRRVGAGASAFRSSPPEQLLTWLDGRNGSSFANITWNGTTHGLHGCRGHRARTASKA